MSSDFSDVFARPKPPPAPLDEMQKWSVKLAQLNVLWDDLLLSEEHRKEFSRFTTRITPWNKRVVQGEIQRLEMARTSLRDAHVATDQREALKEKLFYLVGHVEDYTPQHFEESVKHAIGSFTLATADSIIKIYNARSYFSEKSKFGTFCDFFVRVQEEALLLSREELICNVVGYPLVGNPLLRDFRAKVGGKVLEAERLLRVFNAGKSVESQEKVRAGMMKALLEKGCVLIQKVVRGWLARRWVKHMHPLKFQRPLGRFNSDLNTEDTHPPTRRKSSVEAASDFEARSACEPAHPLGTTKPSYVARLRNLNKYKLARQVLREREQARCRHSKPALARTCQVAKQNKRLRTLRAMKYAMGFLTTPVFRDPPTTVQNARKAVSSSLADALQSWEDRGCFYETDVLSRKAAQERRVRKALTLMQVKLAVVEACGLEREGCAFVGWLWRRTAPRTHGTCRSSLLPPPFKTGVPAYIAVVAVLAISGVQASYLYTAASRRRSRLLSSMSTDHSRLVLDYPALAEEAQYSFPSVHQMVALGLLQYTEPARPLTSDDIIQEAGVRSILGAARPCGNTSRWVSGRARSRSTPPPITKNAPCEVIRIRSKSCGASATRVLQVCPVLPRAVRRHRFPSCFAGVSKRVRWRVSNVLRLGNERFSLYQIYSCYHPSYRAKVRRDACQCLQRWWRGQLAKGILAEHRRRHAEEEELLQAQKRCREQAHACALIQGWWRRLMQDEAERYYRVAAASMIQRWWIQSCAPALLNRRLRAQWATLTYAPLLFATPSSSPLPHAHLLIPLAERPRAASLGGLF